MINSDTSRKTKELTLTVYHVIVEPEHSGQGIAHELITPCLDELEAIGILKTQIDGFKSNALANEYAPSPNADSIPAGGTSAGIAEFRSA